MKLGFWKGIFIISILVIAYIIIFHREYIFSLVNMSKPCKIVVFDLDETLGSFVELGMFWDAINRILGHQKKEHFFEVIDLFDEFLRPKILKILKYIIDRRRDKSCNKIMIYTNNQGPKSWAQMISKYFDKKLKTKVFDQIIAAFKVRGERVELCRTSHGKSTTDLFKCTRIPKNTKICFLDDVYHEDMDTENVFYINVQPYRYSIPYAEMAIRYYEEFNPNIPYGDFITSVEDHMERYGHDVIPKSKKEIDADNVISKQIMIHLEEFFKVSNRKTLKKRRRKGRKTRKSRSKF